MGYSHDEWTPLIIHEKMAGNWDAQSYDQKIKNKFAYNLNKNPPGMLIVGGTRCFGQAVECDCWWRGSKIFTFLLGTAYNVSSMEDIGSSWLLC